MLSFLISALCSLCCAFLSFSHIICLKRSGRLFRAFWSFKTGMTIYFLNAHNRPCIQSVLPSFKQEVGGSLAAGNPLPAPTCAARKLKTQFKSQHIHQDSRQDALRKKKRRYATIACIHSFCQRLKRVRWHATVASVFYARNKHSKLCDLPDRMENTCARNHENLFHIVHWQSFLFHSLKVDRCISDHLRQHQYNLEIGINENLIHVSCRDYGSVPSFKNSPLLGKLATTSSER